MSQRSTLSSLVAGVIKRRWNCSILKEINDLMDKSKQKSIITMIHVCMIILLTMYWCIMLKIRYKVLFINKSEV